MGGEAQNIGAFETQVDQRIDNLGVVVLATGTTRRVGGPSLLAEVTTTAVHHKRFPRRHVQRNHIFTLCFGIGIGRLAGRCNLVSRHAVELGAVEHQLVGVGGLEHILCKAQRQRSNLFVELTETLLFVGRHIGTTTHKTLIGLLEQTELLGVEVATVARTVGMEIMVIDRLNALEQGGIECDIVTMSRQLRCHLFGDSLHLGTVLTLAEVEKDAGHLAQQLATVFVSLNGIGKCGSLATVDDRVDGGFLLTHALFESRHIMLRLDASKIGDFIGRVPRREERIIHIFLVLASRHGTEDDGHCG